MAVIAVDRAHQLPGGRGVGDRRGVAFDWYGDRPLQVRCDIALGQPRGPIR
jgi:hypothetical protein